MNKIISHLNHKGFMDLVASNFETLLCRGYDSPSKKALKSIIYRFLCKRPWGIDLLILPTACRESSCKVSRKEILSFFSLKPEQLSDSEIRGAIQYLTSLPLSEMILAAVDTLKISETELPIIVRHAMMNTLHDRLLLLTHLIQDKRSLIKPVFIHRYPIDTYTVPITPDEPLLVTLNKLSQWGSVGFDHELTYQLNQDTDTQKVTSITISHLSSKQKLWLKTPFVLIEDGWIHINHMPIKTQRLSGWKFHLSVAPEDFNRAMTLLIPVLLTEPGVPLFKIAFDQFRDQFYQNSGKCNALYLDVSKHKKWVEIAERITLLFQENGINPGKKIYGDQSTKGSLYVYRRNDQDTHGTYTPMSTLDALHVPEQRLYNFAGHRDPFL